MERLILNKHMESSPREVVASLTPDNLQSFKGAIGTTLPHSC